jgi:hypothetical protein
MAIIDPAGKVKNKLYEALEAINAPLDLLQIVGSWGETLPEYEILRMLDDFITRATGREPRAEVRPETMTLEELEQIVRAPHQGNR